MICSKYGHQLTFSIPSVAADIRATFFVSTVRIPVHFFCILIPRFCSFFSCTHLSKPRGIFFIVIWASDQRQTGNAFDMNQFAIVTHQMLCSAINWNKPALNQIPLTLHFKKCVPSLWFSFIRAIACHGPWLHVAFFMIYRFHFEAITLALHNIRDIFIKSIFCFSRRSNSKSLNSLQSQPEIALFKSDNMRLMRSAPFSIE